MRTPLWRLMMMRDPLVVVLRLTGALRRVRPPALTPSVMVVMMMRALLVAAVTAALLLMARAGAVVLMAAARAPVAVAPPLPAPATGALVV